MASALKNPLSVDKETLKKLEIKKDPISPLRMLAFLRAQREEMESVLLRARVDVVHAKRLSESDNEVLRNKGLERESTHMNEARQFWGGMQMIDAMIEQLQEENPELKPEA